MDGGTEGSSGELRIGLYSAVTFRLDSHPFVTIQSVNGHYNGTSHGQYSE